MNAGPKPRPATAVPTSRTAEVVVSIAANVIKAPVTSARQPPSITVGGLVLRNPAEAAAPRPVSKKIKTPPQSRFSEWRSCAASDGPSER
jgi:hypothetical protein